jgi:hypothetical protein
MQIVHVSLYDCGSTRTQTDRNGYIARVELRFTNLLKKIKDLKLEAEGTSPTISFCSIFDLFISLSFN